MFEMFTFDKTREIQELKRIIKILEWEATLLKDELDYEERRRELSELNLELALERLERSNSNDHV
jgi:hypothetical protein